MTNASGLDEDRTGTAGHMISALSREAIERLPADSQIEIGRPGRKLFLYPGQLGFDLQEELDILANRAMESNLFFSGCFLAPAIPRLDERQIRLAILRDDVDGRKRSRFVIPFSVEKPGFSVGAPIMRVWSNPFGPLGTPLVDAEDAAETIDNALEALADPRTRLPQVLVLPDLRLDGRFTQLVKAVAMSRDLPLATTAITQRPMLVSEVDGDAYLAAAIGKSHLRDMRRQYRRLAALGMLRYNVARQPAEIRHRLEEFLLLEASGWKGRKRSAMVLDRYRAAFAREAVTNLAEIDAVRIHTLDLDDRAIASLIVFVKGGEAYTWKTAYDERLASGRRQYRAHRFLRRRRSYGDEPLLARARGHGHAGDRPAPQP
jgi:Acetyltransferase (GNAT) domain